MKKLIAGLALMAVFHDELFSSIIITVLMIMALWFILQELNNRRH